MDEMEFRAVLASNLRAERARKKITQEKLAELSNVSPKHVNKIENGVVTPSIYIIFKFAKTLGVTINDLINI